jgi:hypothetical protein
LESFKSMLQGGKVDLLKALAGYKNFFEGYLSFKYVLRFHVFMFKRDCISSKVILLEPSMYFKDLVKPFKDI